MKLVRLIFAVVTLCFASQALADLELGKDYTLVDPAQPTSTGKKIEVMEFFFYGCSHCFKLYPFLSAWEKKKPKDVELVYMPTIFNPAWEPMARTYYALEIMGQQHRLDEDLYNAWNVNNMDLSDQTRVFEFVSKHGIDRKSFEDAYNSFSTGSKIMRNKQMQRTYGITGTPTLIVDGKYRVSGLHPEDAIRVLTALVDKARKERKSKR